MSRELANKSISRASIQYESEKNSFDHKNVEETKDESQKLENSVEYYSTEEDLSLFSYYSGKNILLTGVSDFVGKCLLEKLLRTYILLNYSKYCTSTEVTENCTAIATNSLSKLSASSTFGINVDNENKNWQRRARGTNGIKIPVSEGLDITIQKGDSKANSSIKDPTQKVGTTSKSHETHTEENPFNFKKIYILLNSSHSYKTSHREIFNSPIFDKLKALFHPDQWNQFISDKVHMLESSLEDSINAKQECIDWNTVDLKLSKNDEIALQDIQVIIHSECQHTFIDTGLNNDPELASYSEAFKVNVLGSMMLLNFSKKLHNLESFCYVSSSFVNCDKKGGSYIREEMYPLELPKNHTLESFSEDICFMKFKLSDKKRKTQSNLSGLFSQLGFPNSYTLSKRVAEHMIQKYRQNIPIAIVRPSIIGAADREPIRGWIDPQQVSSHSFSSSTIFLRIGLGLIRILPGTPENHADQIPVDFVVNTIVIAAADVAYRNQLKIFHIGTSAGKNSCTWAETIRGVLSYWQAHPLKMNSSTTCRPEFHMVSKRNWYYAKAFLNKAGWVNQSFEFVTKSVSKPFGSFLRGYAGVNHVGNIIQEMQLQANQITQSNLNGSPNTLTIAFVNDESFHYFTLNEWCFETHNTFDVHKMLPLEEQSIFYLDTENIDWHAYFQYFCYGLVRYCLKENIDPPVFSDLLTREGEHSIIPLSAASPLVPRFMANDISFVYYATSVFNSSKSKSQFISSVMHSKLVQKAIRNEMTKKSCSRTQAEARALAIMDRMFADPQMKYVRTFSYILRKVWRIMYNAIFIDTDEMAIIRKVVSDPESGPLILLPTHRSYVDFLIISFVCFAYDLPIPHIAAGEDFLGMLGVRSLFRHSGAFFLRRSFQDDDLYKAIFHEYVQQLLADGAPLEFFVEGTRSRGGKTMQPKLGLLSIICDAYFTRRVENLTIIPITISYEKVLEREAYSHELLGEQKTPETLGNLLKNVYSILSKSYGNIAVSFSQPIQITHFAAKVTSQLKNNPSTQLSTSKFNPRTNTIHRKFLVKQLASRIAYKLDENAVIMPTALIATIVLQNRHGILYSQLVHRMIWLRQEIIARSGRIYWTPKDLSSSVVDRCLTLMKNEIVRQDDYIRPAVQQLKHMDYTKHIQLHCYRNQLIHIFAIEAIVACSFSACLHSLNIEKGMESSSQASSYKGQYVPFYELEKECQFLCSLINIEFILNPDDSNVDFKTVINEMIEGGILSQESREINTELGEEVSEVPICANEHRLFITNFDSFSFLQQLLWPFIDTYWVCIQCILSLHTNTLNNNDSESQLDRTMLHERMQWLIEKCFFNGQILFYESCCSDIIKNAVSVFIDMKILEKAGKNALVISKKYGSISNLSSLSSHIFRFRKVGKESQMYNLSKL